MSEQSGPVDLVRDAAGRRARRVRLRSDERPLLPVAGQPGPRAERVGDARRGRAGHRAGRVDDLRDLPDHALPPGRRRPAGRDGRPAQRRPVHCSAWARARTSTSTSSVGAGRRRTSATRCSTRRSRSSARSSTATTSTSRASTSGSTPPSCGTSPTQPPPIGIAVSGEQSCELAGATRRRDDRGRAGRRPGEQFDADGGAGQARASVRCRSAGTRPRTPPSSGRTTSSAGSAAAGRSTPSCPARPAFAGGQPVRPARGRRRLDPVRPRRRRACRGGARVRGRRFHRHRGVQIGGESQPGFLDWAEQELLPALRG